MLRQRGVVYDVGRAMCALSVNWRPDYSPTLMRRELDIIRADLHANAVRLGGRAEPLFRRWPDRLTFCLGNELTLFMRGIVPGRSHAKRSRSPSLRKIVLSGQDTLRGFLADAAASVRRVYHGPVSYCALPFERVDWDHFDVVGVNFYRQQGFTTDQYLTKISQFQATGKRVAITEFGFAACRDAGNPEFLATFNATPLSLLGSQLPVVRQHIRPRVRTVHPRDERAQAGLLLDQLQLLDEAGVDGAFVMSFSFPLAPYSEDPRHDLDATALSIVRTLPRGQHSTTHPGVRWEPKEAFHAIARYYRDQEPGSPA